MGKEVRLDAPASGPRRTRAGAHGRVRALSTRSEASAGGLVLLLTLSWLLPPLSGLAGGPDPRPALPGNPFVTDTDPPNEAVGVPLYAWIVVQFNERMNTSNTDVFLDPPMDLTPNWLNNDLTLLLTHATDFPACTTFRVYADGADIEGEGVLVGAGAVPNPWMFTTACPVFTITRTDPEDGQTGVPLNGDYQNIIIWFSQAADPASFELSLSPSIPLTPEWSNGDAKVTMHHANWFESCARHTVTASARDRAGDPLTNVSASRPNPWVFETVCIKPQILRTNPRDGAVDVEIDAPIVVTFATHMNTSLVTVAVDPQPLSSFTWSWEDDRILTLNHSWFFALATIVTVTVAGQDTHGDDLESGPAPNPWFFTTTGFLPAPRGLHVARSSPDIVLTWDAPPWATSFLVYASADKFAPWPWPLLDEVPGTSYRHVDADVDGVSTFYVVRAKDALGTTSGNSTMGVELSLAFTVEAGRTNVHWVSLPYRSSYGTAKDVSDALTATRIEFVIKHNAAAQRSILWYFFRGRWQGTDFPLNPRDLLSISPRVSFTWVVNGTDGPEPLSFPVYPAPNRNTHLVALPPTSAYANASEVVVDIEGGLGPVAQPQIVEVARWDAVTQRLIRFVRIAGGWGGTDFALSPGEGLYVVVASSFIWSPRLITPERP